MGNLLEESDRRALRRRLRNTPFFVPYGCAHRLLNGGLHVPNLRLKKPDLPLTEDGERIQLQDAESYPEPNYYASELEVPDSALWRKLSHLASTQLTDHFPYPNPDIAHCKVTHGGDTWAVGVAIPERADRAEFTFWDKLGFRMPCISIETLSFMNIFLSLPLAEKLPHEGQSVLLSQYGTERTDFTVLIQNRLKFHMESGISPLKESGAEAYCNMLDNARLTMTGFCEGEKLKHRGQEIDGVLKVSLDEPLDVLSLVLPYEDEVLPDWLITWDPLEEALIQMPKRARSVAAEAPSLFAMALGMALQGAG